MQKSDLTILSHISAWEQVYIHVYKLKDSDLGFYHTGIELYGSEFTYCQVCVSCDVLNTDKMTPRASVEAKCDILGSRNCETQTEEVWLGSVPRQHQPRRGDTRTVHRDCQCQFEVCLGMEALEDLLAAMSEEGFSKTDYNVMENSCNTFTEVFDHVDLSLNLSILSPGPGSEAGSDRVFPQRCPQTNKTRGHPVSSGEDHNN